MSFRQVLSKSLFISFFNLQMCESGPSEYYNQSAGPSTQANWSNTQVGSGGWHAYNPSWPNGGNNSGGGNNYRGNRWRGRPGRAFYQGGRGRGAPHYNYNQVKMQLKKYYFRSFLRGTLSTLETTSLVMRRQTFAWIDDVFNGHLKCALFEGFSSSHLSLNYALYLFIKNLCNIPNLNLIF